MGWPTKFDAAHDLIDPEMGARNTRCGRRLASSPLGCIRDAASMSPLKPAVPNHGIVFRRIDLGIDIEARFDRIVATRSRTTLRHSSASGAVVGTVEHLMAALASYGVDNLLIEVDGPELPILDGSAASFVFLLECAGIVAQPVERSASEVLRCVRVENGDAFVELQPFQSGFDLALSENA